MALYGYSIVPPQLTTRLINLIGVKPALSATHKMFLIVSVVLKPLNS